MKNRIILSLKVIVVIAIWIIVAIIAMCLFAVFALEIIIRTLLLYPIWLAYGKNSLSNNYTEPAVTTLGQCALAYSKYIIRLKICKSYNYEV